MDCNCLKHLKHCLGVHNEYAKLLFFTLVAFDLFTLKKSLKFSLQNLKNYTLYSLTWEFIIKIFNENKIISNLYIVRYSIQ